MRDPDKAGDLGPLARIVKLDVDDDASVEAAVVQAGEIDVLVNNAGIGGGGPVEIASITRAKQTFETNYFGAVRMIKAVLPGMRARRGGTIVNVTSVAGRVTLAGHSHYCASKFALDALSEILAAEVRRFGIRVVIVEPGVIETPIFHKRTVDFDALKPYDVPARRLTSFFEKQLARPTPPESVAETIERAISENPGRLRYGVGPDAAVLLERRPHIADEDWIAAQSVDDEEHFRSTMERLLGADLFA
jgi:NAD(P)-dependent dehydrogenase (short-subunit alcohol dehydrogenase family)